MLAKISFASDIKEYSISHPEFGNLTIVTEILIKDDACRERCAYLSCFGSQCDLAAMKLV